ncbi:MAG TPA: adenylate/guanylate cyclase domain-containing protein [Actinomycetes bacterium]|jgi:adenylate cyclase|nr:adenylate/guanylate cyclase domain-containing protein [Actinomycetes bacterium]
METETGPLSASELADLAGVTKAEVDRLVGLGILVARDGAGPFLAADARKIRLATACEQAGLPMDGIAAAIRAGRLSFAFLEAAPFRRWAVRSARTYRQVSQDTGIPLDTLGSALESMGFARMAPDEPIREDELEIVPLLQRGLSSGLLDLAWLTRLGRAHADGLRLIATAWGEAYQARFEGAVLASGADQQTAMELAARRSVDFLPLADPALLAIYRRQQELMWTEGLVERIEHELEAAGVLRRPERVPAMSFLDLVGYTRLTEEQGDRAAAALAETLAVLVDRSSREHGGVPVKWLGDGVMVRYPEPAGAVLSALRLVARLPQAGLPPAHVGVAAGPVVAQGGDYFGRTVNLAARIAARAGAGQVLVSGSVAESASPEGVRFVELGELRLAGFARPVRLLEARGG